jgi:thiamine biosynthesis lipoprotein
MMRCKPLLGTFVEISTNLELEDSNPIDLTNAINDAFSTIKLVHDLMGFHNPNSELSKINAYANLKTVQIHEWTFEVLKIAKDLFEISQGIFDCGVGKYLVQSGLLPKHQESINKNFGGLMDLLLIEPNLVSSKKPLRLDLGGIAKGFAVDKAVEVLRSQGVQSGCVNAGGDLRVFGENSQEIKVRNPSKPDELFTIGSLKNGSIASSALYYCDNSKANMGHIVDPFTKEHIEFCESYSIVAPECVFADALTKVLAITKDHQHPCFQKYSAQVIRVAS